jgi:hypothetical protein
VVEREPQHSGYLERERAGGSDNGLLVDFDSGQRRGLGAGRDDALSRKRRGLVCCCEQHTNDKGNEGPSHTPCRW